MLDPARPFFISPPFGTYLRHPRAYSVSGSYTRYPRPGRLAQILRTVRPLGREPDGSPKGWLNKVGLRNPGFTPAKRDSKDPYRVCSVAMIEGDDAEWGWLLGQLRRGVGPRRVEVNVSCPNTDHPLPALPDDGTIRVMTEIPDCDIIFKLPPIPGAVDAALRLAGAGARYLHLSNTLPTPAGGISGPALRETNLALVERAANDIAHAGFIVGRTPWDSPGASPGISFDLVGIEIIAGGGIYSADDLRRYRDAGATRFSLSSAFFKPWRGYNIIKTAAWL